MIADNSIKNKTTHMRRASIYTENDKHPTIREDGEHLVPSLQKGKKVPLPKKVTGLTPQLTRFSGQLMTLLKNGETREKNLAETNTSYLHITVPKQQVITITTKKRRYMLSFTRSKHHQKKNN